MSMANCVNVVIDLGKWRRPEEGMVDDMVFFIILLSCKTQFVQERI